MLYVYPRTGVPGVDAPPGWDDIPGARGCTPQSCGFRDHFAELKRLGVAHVYGLSTQDTGLSARSGGTACICRFQFCPMPTSSSRTPSICRLSDVRHDIAQAHGDGHRRWHEIVKAFYPVFPPDKNAEEVITWLRRGGDAGFKLSGESIALRPLPITSRNICVVSTPVFVL